MIDNSINVLETTNANNALEVINLLESSYIESKKLSSKIARETMFNAIDLIITISKLSDDKHRIVSILELNKIQKEKLYLKKYLLLRLKVFLKMVM